MPVGGGVRRQLPGLQQRGLVQGRETCVYARRRHKRNDDPVSESKRVTIASAKWSSLSCGEVQARVHESLLRLPRGAVPALYGSNQVQKLQPGELPSFGWPKRVQSMPASVGGRVSWVGALHTVRRRLRAQQLHERVLAVPVRAVRGARSRAMRPLPRGMGGGRRRCLVRCTLSCRHVWESRGLELGRAVA